MLSIYSFSVVSLQPLLICFNSLKPDFASFRDNSVSQIELDNFSALYKLSYGASKCSSETIEQVSTNRAFFATDVNNAQHDINDFQQIDFDGDGKISDEELRK